MYSSDEEPDPELLELLRKSRGLTLKPKKLETHVLESSRFIVDHSVDVALSRDGVVQAAELIYEAMSHSQYSTESWARHKLHPKPDHEDTLSFIFTLDLLNFSFWSEFDDDKRFRVNYAGESYTGYWSMVALLRRALDQGIPITNPYFWVDTDICTNDLLRYVFRSDAEEQIPLMNERICCLREAGDILCKRYDGNFSNCVRLANKSAAALVMLVVENFPCFNDEHEFEGKRVRFYKRAQILVADIWACYNKKDYGEFEDIDKITMFADYRVPTMLNALSCLLYSPSLAYAITAGTPIPLGSSYEIQLRGCSIWCVEMIRQTIIRRHPGTHINSILIDFYLYDTAKKMEAEELERQKKKKRSGRSGNTNENMALSGWERRVDEKEKCFAGEEWRMIPHHKTRSIWY